MKKITAIAISSGIIAAIWTAFSFTVGLSTVAGFLAWSSFFAAGGGISGVKKALFANLSGICWGFLSFKMTNLLIPSIGETYGFTVGNGLGSAAICLQSKIELVSYIPAAFIGWSALIASGMNFKITFMSMIVGSFMGYFSEKLTNLLLKNSKENEKNIEKSA